jgi:translation initiation factor 2 beta subunit (eIF-2beta)/eIF-5
MKDIDAMNGDELKALFDEKFDEALHRHIKRLLMIKKCDEIKDPATREVLIYLLEQK